MVSNLQAWGVWIGLFILFSGIGYYVLHYILFKDYEIKKKLANFVFCGTFAFSLNTLSLILYEIFQVGDSDTILVMWAVNLSCLVFSLLFFIPFIAFFQGIQKVQMSQFWKVVLWFKKISFLCIQFCQAYHGTYLIAIVSGFGVVYGPFCFSYSKDSSFDSQIDYVHEELNIINEALKDYYQGKILPRFVEIQIQFFIIKILIWHLL
ncbi:hypothetical protein PPERSA_05236 [Pseudocohnilembus persalinus]|uniref:Transmembrane protein n=1 Tax=Pseudocohnilembus persalinus TaxID=266149 RepID=A0A0V0QYF5_PSEPJ|nr:hypothetical protein PPERSA_05236 [Pseudocohnilembus persalinus]|eukprot:KRX07072.1 hypothetical protein PPERSA_05236 [Pseudocohnilembus persalinus]